MIEETLHFLKNIYKKNIFIKNILNKNTVKHIFKIIYYKIHLIILLFIEYV